MIVSRDNPIRAWHFLYEGHKLRTGEPAPADGEWLVHPGIPAVCRSGLHASLDPYDALAHAPGPVLCLVDCAGEVIENEDKLVCTERRIVARMDAEPLLREFARGCALSVVHNWRGGVPDVVLDWLMGDDGARSAAAAAARSAAWSAAARSAAAAAAARSAARSELQALVNIAFADYL